MSGQPGKIRIAAVGQQQVALLALDPGVVLRRPGQVEFRAGDVILGVVLDPGVIQSRVIGNEVQQQAQAALAEPLAQPGQSGIAAQVAHAPCSR